MAVISEIKIQEKKARLPIEYQEVEYLESNGTQFIDTKGYQINDTIEVIGNASGMLINCLTGLTTGRNFTIQLNNLGNVLTYGYVVIDSDEIIGDYKKIKATITGNGNFGRIFAYYNTSVGGAIGKLVSFIHKRNNELYEELVPCYRKSDNVAGMYDLVEGVFYTNGGTGEFTIGASVDLNITKYNNQTIKQITHDGNTIEGLPAGNYHFAKNTESSGVCDNAVNEPIIDMQIKGNSIQNGTPTTEAPIEIQSVGDYDEETGKYKLSILKTGKNLFNNELPYTDITSTRIGSKEKLLEGLDAGQTIFLGFNASTTVGAENKTFSQANVVTAIVRVKNNRTYAIKGYVKNKVCFIDENFITVKSQNLVNGTVTNDVNAKYMAYYTHNGAQYNQGTQSWSLDDVLNITQIEEGFEKTDYEPYVKPQTYKIYLNEPLRKMENYADVLSYKDKKVLRYVEVLDDSGTQTIENSYKGLSVPIEETIEIPEISTIDGTNKFDVETTISPSDFKVNYWKQI